MSFVLAWFGKCICEYSVIYNIVKYIHIYNESVTNIILKTVTNLNINFNVLNYFETNS